MSNLKSCTWRGITLGAIALSGLLAAPLSAIAAEPTTTPTFTKDVAPIFQAKCEACHRPDSIAPMSLVTFEETRPFATAIKNRVATRQMPPWHIDKTIGIQKFKNDRSLSDEQIDTIVRWVNAGAPKGDVKDMPAAVKWPDESKWNFADIFGGPPDLIIKSTPYLQKAGGQDAWWKPSVDVGLTEPRWVRAIEIRPSTVQGRKVVHHAIANLRQDESLARSAFGILTRRPVLRPRSPERVGRSWSGRSASRAKSCARTQASSCCLAPASPGTFTTPTAAKT